MHIRGAIDQQCTLYEVHKWGKSMFSPMPALQLYVKVPLPLAPSPKYFRDAYLLANPTEACLEF